jgi:hypothetical protein
MPTHVARRFTLFDAMVLIAATAVGFVPMRYLYTEVFANSGPADWTQESIYELAMVVNILIAPIVIAWSAALSILRMRHPRPRLWRVCRQPGMTACLAILVATFFFVTKDTILLGFMHFGQGLALRDLAEIASSPYHWFTCVVSIESSVLAVWIVLWLGRVGRREPSWIDRTGRALGVYCIVCGILCGWAGLLAYYRVR